MTKYYSGMVATLPSWSSHELANYVATPAQIRPGDVTPVIIRHLRGIAILTYPTNGGLVLVGVSMCECVCVCHIIAIRLGHAPTNPIGGIRHEHCDTAAHVHLRKHHTLSATMEVLAKTLKDYRDLKVARMEVSQRLVLS